MQFNRGLVTHLVLYHAAAGWYMHKWLKFNYSVHCSKRKFIDCFGTIMGICDQYREQSGFGHTQSAVTVGLSHCLWSLTWIEYDKNIEIYICSPHWSTVSERLQSGSGQRGLLNNHTGSIKPHLEDLTPITIHPHESAMSSDPCVLPELEQNSPVSPLQNWLFTRSGPFGCFYWHAEQWQNRQAISGQREKILCVRRHKLWSRH